MTTTNQALECSGAEVAVDGIDVIGDKFGVFTNCSQVVIRNSQGVELDDGIELANSIPGGVVAMLTTSLVQKTGGTGTLLDFASSVWAFVSVSSAQFISQAGGTDISGLSSSGNLIPSIGRGEITNGRANGAGTHLDGITPDDILWDIHNVAGIRASTVLGTVSVSVPALTTVDSTPGNFVKIAGTTASTFLRRVDTNGASNRVRFINPDTGTIRIDVQADLAKSGSSKLYQIQIVKNGTTPIGVPQDISVSNSGASVTTFAFDDASTDDFYEAFIANTVDTDDVTANELQLSLTAVS